MRFFPDIKNLVMLGQPWSLGRCNSSGFGGLGHAGNELICVGPFVVIHEVGPRRRPVINETPLIPPTFEAPRNTQHPCTSAPSYSNLPQLIDFIRRNGNKIISISCRKRAEWQA